MLRIFLLLTFTTTAVAQSPINRGSGYNPYTGTAIGGAGGLSGVVPGIPTAGPPLIYLPGPYGPQPLFRTPAGYMTLPTHRGLPVFIPNAAFGGATNGYTNGYTQGGTAGYGSSPGSTVAEPVEAPPAMVEPKPADPKPVPLRPVGGRQKKFDQWNYDQANVRSPDDIRNDRKREALIAALEATSGLEITTGEALNVIAEALQPQLAQVAKTPAIPLDEEMRKRINYARQNTIGSIGLLRDGGKLTWPTGCKTLPSVEEATKLREEIDKRFATAALQIQSGPADAENLKQLAQLSSRLSELVSAGVHELDFNAYMEAKRYLKDFEDTLRFLRQADAGQWLPGRTPPQTLQELLQRMNDRGVRFAPALVGNDPAYIALHRQLTTLYRTLTGPRG